MQASAGFVSASALGMACGPALAGLLQIKFKFLNLTFNQDTLPGWVMAAAWLLYLVWLWIAFVEPPFEDDNVEQQSTTGMLTVWIKIICIVKGSNSCSVELQLSMDCLELSR